MYVADMSLEDARAFLKEAHAERAEALRNGGRFLERIDWDIEDLEDRIYELEHPMPKLTALMQRESPFFQQ